LSSSHTITHNLSIFFNLLVVIILSRFKCCKQDTISQTATKELPLPIAPEDPIKPEVVIDDAATEASVEEVQEAEAEVKAVEASYNCCAIW
jgi:hypothetical protein